MRRNTPDTTDWNPWPLRLGATLLLGWLLMLAWNLALAGQIEGLGPIGMLQALGILALIRTLKGAGRPAKNGQAGKKPFPPLIRNITIEERDAFREQFRRSRSLPPYGQCLN